MQGGVISQKMVDYQAEEVLVAGRSLLGVATLATMTKGLQEDHGPADVAQTAATVLVKMVDSRSHSLFHCLLLLLLWIEIQESTVFLRYGATCFSI